MFKDFAGFSIFLTLSFLLACNSKKIKRVLIDNEYAEGEISIDTVFNGVIKYYDTSKNTLTGYITYNNGVFDGERKDFYANGKLKNRINYVNGRTVGFKELYDSFGNILTKQNTYYDIGVGPSIRYKNGKVSEFWYHSFENEVLAYIDYNLIYGKKISEILKDFFFLKKRSLFANDFGDTTNLEDEYRIYLVDPPGYKFAYTFCIIDSSYQVLKTLKEFDTSNVWDSFSTNITKMESGQSFAIRIKVTDLINKANGIATMFKRLK